jgi:hypothetical protein
MLFVTEHAVQKGDCRQEVVARVHPQSTPCVRSSDLLHAAAHFPGDLVH